MQRRRFYAAPEDIDGSTVRLSREETHHLTRVLRLGRGDEVFVFDGCGNEYRCEVVGIETDRAQLEIIDRLADEVESPVDLTLAQALAKGEKFDLIIQKATELGVRRIAPIATEHADVKLKDEQAAKRLERWRRISLEALKQCGRRTLVEILTPLSLEEFLNASDVESKAQINSNVSRVMLVFNERGGSAIGDALADVERSDAVTALIGPEGGWSEAELDLLEKRGARFVTLGPRILRTETAAIAAVTLIEHALGDLPAGAAENH